MDIELLAKEMRERALLIEANYPPEQLKSKNLRKAKEAQRQKVEEFKKLYFNAGRWAGGARDNVAREAFERVNTSGLRA